MPAGAQARRAGGGAEPSVCSVLTAPGCQVPEQRPRTGPAAEGVFLRGSWSWREVRGRVSCVLRDGAGVHEQPWQCVRPGRWGHKDLGDQVCREQGGA